MKTRGCDVTVIMNYFTCIHTQTHSSTPQYPVLAGTEGYSPILVSAFYLFCPHVCLDRCDTCTEMPKSNQQLTPKANKHLADFREFTVIAVAITAIAVDGPVPNLTC